MKSIFLSRFLILMLCLWATTPLYAASQQIDNLTIKKIRAVGTYSTPNYSNTIEIWFNESLALTSSIPNCTNTSRVYVDAKHKHILMAAYLAMATGKKVNINIDDTLPIRASSCEISFLDVVAN